MEQLLKESVNTGNLYKMQVVLNAQASHINIETCTQIPSNLLAC